MLGVTVNSNTPLAFPISRDPPEGGTLRTHPKGGNLSLKSFQFLGIPPKGELVIKLFGLFGLEDERGCFQFLGIPPKGELLGG